MSDPASEPHFILTMTCPDRTGIVAATTGCLADQGCFITEASQFADPDSRRFFSRIVFRIENGQSDESRLRRAFGAVAERFSMQYRLRDAEARPRVLIMVSRADHCLNDLLYRYRRGFLRMEIPAILSNHTTLAPLAEAHGLPFHHLPVGAENRAEQESRLRALFAETGADYLVLARYMQILSGPTCEALQGRVINIHHSFLPGFKGARPYHQAHERGVKLIGATAHFVTEDLDDGPIIEQEVQRVDHSLTADQMAAVGRDIEAQVLARALSAVLDDRVLLNGTRTVVLR